MAKKKKSKKRMLREELKYKVNDIEHNLTRSQYRRHLDRFAIFCYEKYNCKACEDCVEHIQDYANYLVERNLSPSTIHTYLAAVCKAFEINMKEIEKPIRHTAEFTRGRRHELPVNRSDMDLDNYKYQKIVDFQKHVGIRRNELKHLKGGDIGYDANGKLCVVVQNGKGGKQQYQVVEEGYEDLISSYFEKVPSHEYIFTEYELNNKLNFHALRALRAQEEYIKILQKLQDDYSYRDKLEKELRERWQSNINKETGQVKRLNQSDISGYYYLRGKNKQYAKDNGLPIKYDKLAVMYVSICVLSHWRNNVTVQNYLNIVPNI